jgi:hypothetical protein
MDSRQCIRHTTAQKPARAALRLEQRLQHGSFRDEAQPFFFESEPCVECCSTSNLIDRP